jgi:hypothetical protein
MNENGMGKHKSISSEYYFGKYDTKKASQNYILVSILE